MNYMLSMYIYIYIGCMTLHVYCIFWTYVCMYVCKYIYICIYIYVYIYMIICIYVCM